ncbi:rubrerythrin family protein [Natronomonas marina]|jgi:hypothetical protein|uniref:rubrerythrin family protein n=1 Tax=Natronomonas marina TaxID=2961939 RepID=UPI0020C97478|nr:rubrerythrin family protein [Natronomonas marina]
MDGADFLETVRESNATALERLGSEKALVAVTDAALDRERVLETAAAAEARAVATFEAWTDDEADDRAREAFREVAASERDHYDRVCALGDVAAPDPPADALHAYLRELDDTVERAAAGLVARPLVASRTLLQVISFFINESEAGAADVFRELRAETDEGVEAGAAVVAGVCDDADRERAETAAGRAIEAAYGEYVDSLEGLGIDPKPVC